MYIHGYRKMEFFFTGIRDSCQLKLVLQVTEHHPQHQQIARTSRTPIGVFSFIYLFSLAVYGCSSMENRTRNNFKVDYGNQAKLSWCKTGIPGEK